MRTWIVGAIAALAVLTAPASLAAQSIRVHAGVRVSDHVAIELHVGAPLYRHAVFVPMPVSPYRAHRRAVARHEARELRKLMQAYERELRKFEREHERAHRLGIPHVHVRGGIRYLEPRAETFGRYPGR
jgi:hypothetical protein